MKRMTPFTKGILLCCLVMVAAAPPASAAQKFVEFTVPDCQ